MITGNITHLTPVPDIRLFDKICRAITAIGCESAVSNIDMERTTRDDQAPQITVTVHITDPAFKTAIDFLLNEFGEVDVEPGKPWVTCSLPLL